MHSTPISAVPFAKHEMSSLHIFHWQQSSQHKTEADMQQWKSIVARLYMFKQSGSAFILMASHVHTQGHKVWLPVATCQQTRRVVC